MKKLLLLLLCTTAFAYEGERLVFDVPKHLDRFTECGYSDRLEQTWQKGRECFSVMSQHNREISVEDFLHHSCWHGAERVIVELKEDGVTFFYPGYCCGRLIITKDGYHTLDYTCTDIESALPYIQNAYVGIPITDNAPYQEERLALSSLEGWTLDEVSSRPDFQGECWSSEKWDIYFGSSRQKEPPLTLHDFYYFVLGQYSFTPECVPTISIIERSEDDMILGLQFAEEEDDEIEIYYVRLIVTATALHQASTIAHPNEEKESLALLKSIAVTS